MTKGNQSEGLINHFNSARLKCHGSCALQMRLISLDDVRESILIPLVLTPLMNRHSHRLANFSEQQARFEGKVTEIDEWFRISTIVIYYRPSMTQYPG